MAIKLPPQISTHFPFPFLTVGSRRRQSPIGIASLSDLFRDPQNSLNTLIWTTLSSSHLIVQKGILDMQTSVTGGQTFIRARDRQGWTGFFDGPAVWIARIKKDIDYSGSPTLICQFGLITSNQSDRIQFSIENSETTMTPIVRDGTQQSGSAFTVTNNVWHTFKIEANASNQIKFYLDNVLKATLTDSNDIPWTKELFPFFRVWDANSTGSEAIVQCNSIKMSF